MKVLPGSTDSPRAVAPGPGSPLACLSSDLICSHLLHHLQPSPQVDMKVLTGGFDEGADIHEFEHWLE